MAVEYSPSFFLGRRDDIVNNMASESRGRDFVSVSVMLKVKLLAGNVPAVTVGTVLWRRYAGASLEEKSDSHVGTKLWRVRKSVEQSNELTGPPGLLSYAITIAPELHSGTLIFDHRIVNSE